MSIDATDRRIIEATQAGLPLTPAPYAQVAARLDLTEAEVIARLTAMAARGVVRRIGAAPNHYAFGMAANGMTVWDVEDEMVAQLGAEIGALDFVSHCYQRRRVPPVWPYNLYAMVHGRDHAEVEVKRGRIAELLGPCCHGSDVLYSTRILKKAGLRLAARGGR